MCCSPLCTMRQPLSVVDVYSGWCGPCKAVVGLLRRLKNEVGRSGLLFAAVSTYVCMWSALLAVLYWVYAWHVCMYVQYGCYWLHVLHPVCLCRQRLTRSQLWKSTGRDRSHVSCSWQWVLLHCGEQYCCPKARDELWNMLHWYTCIHTVCSVCLVQHTYSVFNYSFCCTFEVESVLNLWKL